MDIPLNHEGSINDLLESDFKMMFAEMAKPASQIDVKLIIRHFSLGRQHLNFCALTRTPVEDRVLLAIPQELRRQFLETFLVVVGQSLNTANGRKRS